MIRGGLIANARPKEVAVRAVITRANGEIVDLGTVDYYHRNPFRRLLWRMRTWLKRTT